MDDFPPDQVSLERLSLARRAWQLRNGLEAGDSSLSDELGKVEDRLDGRAFRVPSEELPELHRQLKKSIKQAERMGAVPPLFQVIEHEMVEVVSDSTGVRSARQASLIVLVGGEVSPAEGWRYLARLDHLAAGKPNILLRLPGSGEVDLSGFISAPPRCEHCNLSRRRNSSYLVESPDGRVRQVGSGCLSDYIGGVTPDQALRYAESLLDLSRLLSEGEKRLSAAVGWAGSNPQDDGFFDPEQYLSWVALQEQQDGEFISRSKAFDTGLAATADSARSLLLAALKGAAPVLPSPDQERLARDCVAWARSRFSPPRASLTGFELRAAEILDNPLCSYRELPVLAALLPAYKRELEAQKQGVASRHLGSPGERIDLQAEVISVSERETDFGLQHIYQMRDDQGNLLVWFSSSSAQLDKGERYELRGTVKRHDDFKGVKRTVLTRCRVAE